MTPEEILAQARKSIEEHAQGDPDKRWYANRFVFARLQLDERQTKTAIKRRLFEQDAPCHFCGKPFAERKNVPLHRLDEDKGYSDGNCVLAHKECHEAHHNGDSRRKTDHPSRTWAVKTASGTLRKHSKRYDGSFFYWWDIAPNLADTLDRFDGVEFLCDDTGASYLVPVSELKKFLLPERQTSRGQGHWGIRVLKGHEDELAFEPGTGKGKWLYLPVTWMQQEADD